MLAVQLWRSPVYLGSVQAQCHWWTVLSASVPNQNYWVMLCNDYLYFLCCRKSCMSCSKDACITLRLHIPFKEIQSESGPVASRASELLLKGNTGSRSRSSRVLNVTNCSSRIHHPEGVMGQKKGQFYHDTSPWTYFTMTHLLGPILDCKTWKYGKAFPSQGKVWEFLTNWKITHNTVKVIS